MAHCFRCCHATNACCCLKYLMCFLQFILTFLYFTIENLITVITFILTFSCFYYKLRWKLYTHLSIIDSPNPLQQNTKTKTAPKSTDTKSPNTAKYSLSITNHDDEHNEYDVRYEESKDKDDTSSHTLKILTQNLWVHYLAPSPTKTKRLHAFIQFLKQKQNHYDILILQEIFALRFGYWIRCNDLEFLVKELHQIGYIYYTKPSGNLPYFGQNGGIMLFSRYPFIYDDVFRFRKSDEIMLRKGFAIAVAKIPLKYIDKETYYHLCIGTAHCDPYRPKVILSQIQHFSKQIQTVYADYKQKGTGNMDIIVGGDFNTRINALSQGLHDYFENIISMYNAWTLKGNERKDWNNHYVTYRSSYIAKYRVWLSILSCGLFKLPSMHEMTGKYKNGYCLDHILTNVRTELVENVSVVDTRYKDVFVSDHLGVELVMRLPVSSEK